jgi:hypothetical protein
MNTRSSASTVKKEIVLISTLLLSGFLAGCTGFTRPAAITTQAGTALRGTVHGGQQPVVGATIQLYAAGIGATSPNTNLLTRTVTTDASGNFNIDLAYSCTAGQQMYIVALGGDPGGGTNGNLALMSALGDCNTLTTDTYISINEVTTVASVFALAPFMTGITTLGAPSANTLGLAHAFASVNKLANIATGAAGGPALPAGALAPIAKIDTLANAIAACVNSTGTSDTNAGACGMLFAATTVGTAPPSDTIQAALNIALHPAANVGAIYDMSSAKSPFPSPLSAAPSDWTLAVVYSTGGFNTPKSSAVDANGNIWIANAGNNSVSVLQQNGSPLANSPFTGNGLSTPSAIAIDSTGNAWIANATGTSVSAFTPTGGQVSGSPFTGNGTISSPSSVAIDAPGNIWVSNVGNDSITELGAGGIFVQQVSSGVSKPTAVAIDPQ